ncbi:Zn-dependent peptidase ImmA (M78 family) [Crossiella cryophila]|uniref:Zn-dependent peptidase ImmA (M78 family) n=1 Tax=Crossiella cryophila TaxID=43355 RepID=A0A7W7FPY1_9PSEU|nr:Zn-dependent peptidase ImmA (M78 family) [Crossiella cryophila]
MLNELDIRPPLDVTELCRRVGERRGKPIRLVAHPIPVPGPFGVWIATETADYILYQERTTKSHQNHIILHELGHLLAGHRSGEGHDDPMLTALYPDIEPDAVRRALRRTSYDDSQELEAETVATIILEWASVLDRVAPGDSADVPTKRIENALGDRLGWL